MTTSRTGAGRRRRGRGGAVLAAAVSFAVALGMGASTAAVADIDDEGYTVIFDGTQESFDQWAYAGQGGFDLLEDGTTRSRAGIGGGFGTLWYPVREYSNFSLKLEFRDDAPGGANLRGNSGVQVRFPDLSGPVEGCPTTFNGNETNNLSWIAVNCGHEIQINDSPEQGNNDPRKTGSVYGFADLDIQQAQPTAKGEWNDYEIRVVGQHYTVIRNGEVINRYENLPGVPFPGRPNDPDSSSRGLSGYVGLQAHGSNPDIVSFRNVRIKELPQGAGDVDISVDIEQTTEPGHLALSVDGDQTVLQENGSDALVRQFTGGLPTVTVTDTRGAEEIPDGAAWYVLGSATDFAGSDGASIGVDHLGWSPELVSGSESGQVVAGAQVGSVVDGADPAGLVDRDLLAVSTTSAEVTAEGEWSAAAELSLRTPATVTPGSYGATLTLSLFE